MTEPLKEPQAQVDVVAKAAAEFYNGGNFNDPLYYTDEQKEVWRNMAKAILAAIAQRADYWKGQWDASDTRRRKAEDENELLKAEIERLKQENAMLRDTLDLIANHRIDSQLASSEKRAMARNALKIRLPAALNQTEGK